MRVRPTKHGAERNVSAAKAKGSSVFLIPLLLVAVAQGQGAEQDPSKARHAPAPAHVAPAPRTLAVGYEHAGRKAEAAAIYEGLARTNSVARKVLAPRLVQIYAETGQTNKALAWAHEVMRANPDPQAYLAGIHARLGQLMPAREILEREIAGNTNATRAVTLRWQLADVCEKDGNSTQARRVLGEAAAAAKGTPMEPAAEKRWNAVKQQGR